MIRLDRTVDLEAPLEDVFAFVGEFANVSRWDPGVESSHKTSAGPTGVGTAYRVVARFLGVSTPMVYRVVAWSPPAMVELHGETSTVRAVDRISVSAAGAGRTRVRYEAEFGFRGPLRLLEPLLRPVFERIGDVAMGGLARARIPSAGE